MWADWLLGLLLVVFFVLLLIEYKARRRFEMMYAALYAERAREELRRRESPPRTISEMQEMVHETARSKGWWDEYTDEDGVISRERVLESIGEKIALIHSEGSEALEDARVGKIETYDGEGGKPCGMLSEIADVVIRCMDLVEALRGDLGEEIVKKNAFNRTRAHRHGGKKF